MHMTIECGYGGEMILVCSFLTLRKTDIKPVYILKPLAFNEDNNVWEELNAHKYFPRK